VGREFKQNPFKFHAICDLQYSGLNVPSGEVF